MQYNFKVRTALSDEEANQIVSEAAEGLETSTQFTVELKIRVNTELPDEKVDSLQEAVNKLISEKIGVDSEVELISKEN